MRDAEVAYAIHPIVRKYRLTTEDTTKALLACAVSRAANVAQITTGRFLSIDPPSSGSLSALRKRSSDMPKQKRKHDFGGSRWIPKRDMPLQESASPKQRKQLAHNAPVRRVAGKFRE
jgi:hypothetical protein